MSDTSPVVREEEETKLFFPALKIVAGYGGDSEEAKRKRKMAGREAASKDLRH